jgi:formylglycine-generating enzyme
MNRLKAWLQPKILGTAAIVLGGSLGASALWFQTQGKGEPQAKAAGTCPENMNWIQGGTFTMGSNDHYAEEESVEDVQVTGFCIDRHEVTNGQFAEFVAATGYKTLAERPLSAQDYPQLTEAQRQPGSLVFKMPEDPTQPIMELSWWHWTPGANWQHPEGPGSSIEGLDNYPVVHIAWEDAIAYAQWAKKQLPTEAQWEFAARGGLEGMVFTWGNEYRADLANSWQGKFPFVNTKEDGHPGLAPVGSYPANGYGLHDMAGNVWEWTQDWYRSGHDEKHHQTNPTGPAQEESFDPGEPGVSKHVIKGGSYLCAPNYCSRFRPGARESQSPDTGTSHIGFRLVVVPDAGTTP